jgi:hypothetical protein
VTAFLRRHPLAFFLPLQALLTFWHLGLLSPWMDEAGTLLTLHDSLAGVLRFASQDVHPPLYYLLLFIWQRIPLGLDWAVQARALSVIFALLSTVALDRLWVRTMDDRLRMWFLALWSLSPCLLLYARMSRSYSLQVLLAVIAIAYLLRFAARPGWRDGCLLAIAMLAALYTHYAAGLAIGVAVNLLLASGGLWLPLIAVDAAVAAGYAPWIGRLIESVTSWTAHGAGYTVTGHTWLDLPLKLAYWAVSFTMGEAMPDLLLLFGVAVMPVALWLAWAGAKEYRRTATVTGLLIAAAFVGVARWVSYPFVPARMLFVLPFLLFLVVAGADMHRRVGNFVLGSLLALSLAGAWCYFTKTSFRNKQYPMPMREIAAYIRDHSRAEDSVVLIDSANSDPTALQYALGPSRPVLQTTRPGTERALAESRARTIWFLHNTHDISTDGVNTRIEAHLRAIARPTTYYYQPYSLLERALMVALGMRDPPWYFHELLEVRR